MDPSCTTCPRCGTSVNAKENEIAGSYYSEQIDRYNAEQKRRKKPIIIIAILLIVFASIGLTIALTSFLNLL